MLLIVPTPAALNHTLEWFTTGNLLSFENGIADVISSFK